MLEKAIQAAARVLRDSLDKRGITLQVDCRHAPPEIRVQESRFHQMMVNLIKNAMEAIDELAAAGDLAEAPCIGMGGQINALSDGVGRGCTLRIMLRLASLALPPAGPAAGKAAN